MKQDTLEGKAKTKNGVKRLCFSIICILLEVIFIITVTNASGQSGVFEQNKRNNSESRKYSKLHTKKFAVSNLSEYGYCVF